MTVDTGARHTLIGMPPPIPLIPFNTEVDARKMLPGSCISGRLRVAVGESRPEGRAWSMTGDDDGVE